MLPAETAVVYGNAIEVPVQLKSKCLCARVCLGMCICAYASVRLFLFLLYTTRDTRDTRDTSGTRSIHKKREKKKEKKQSRGVRFCFLVLTGSEQLHSHLRLYPQNLVEIAVVV